MKKRIGHEPIAGVLPGKKVNKQLRYKKKKQQVRSFQVVNGPWLIRP
jgi:hypothetical protein